MSFKRGLADPKESWTLAGTALSNNGEQVIDLRDVTGGRYRYLNIRRSGVRVLTLDAQNGSVNLPTHIPSSADRAGLEHFRSSVLARCSAVSPDLRFDVAGGRGVVLFNFAISLFALIIACSLFVGTLLGEGSRLGLALAIVSFVCGAWSTWRYRPWDYDRFMLSGADADAHMSARRPV